MLPWLFILVATVAQAKNVTLSWDPSPSNVSGYTLYWDSQPNPPFENKIEAGDILNFLVTNLENSEQHWFAVTAHDDLGNESVYSNIVTSLPIEPEPLPQLDLEFFWEVIEGH